MTCWIACVHGFGPISPTTRNTISRCFHGNALKYASTSHERLPVVWVEEAEDDFVDEEENLEEGEVCLKSLKAFASAPTTHPSSFPRFLCAGALVQRPSKYQVCDAWTADSLLDEGGPNLQLQGALKLLDELLLFHLHRHVDNTILGLQTFVVKCGSLDSHFTCASYMAAKARGFRPLRELVRVSSIYVPSLYDHDLDGMVMAAEEAKEIYRKLAFSTGDESQSSDEQPIALTIYHLLPDDDTVRRCTHKRLIVPKQ